MRKKVWTKAVSLTAAAMMAMGALAGCGTAATKTESQSEAKSEETASGGKILLLSSLSNGAYYDYEVAYYKEMCKELGYDFQVVYADAANDPDGNLSQVKNAYTDDVVGLITMVDGGIGAIMEEYPELYVASLGTSMNAIYGEQAANPELADNDHWLGGINENSGDGERYGKQMAESVIDFGYSKVAICTFPSYAYPEQTVAAETFTAEIEKYNETAAQPVEIVGEPTVLSFAPLDESFFMEEGKGDLDAIVGFCAGTKFIYSTMVTAKANGTCDQKTKLVTGGYDNDEAMLADCGDEGQTITALSISCPEYTLYPLALLDNAITGKQFSDWEKAEIINPGSIVLHTTEEFQASKNNSPLWDADLDKLAISLDDMKPYFTRYDDSASYEDMVKAIQGITVESYLEK